MINIPSRLPDFGPFEEISLRVFSLIGRVEDGRVAVLDGVVLTVVGDGGVVRRAWLNPFSSDSETS